MYRVVMPALEMAQETGTLLRWLKQEGEPVQRGEPLMEIETDKVTLEIEAGGSGVLAQVSAAPGDVVPVGQVIALLLAEGETAEGVAPATPQPLPVPGEGGSPFPPSAGALQGEGLQAPVPGATRMLPGSRGAGAAARRVSWRPARWRGVWRRNTAWTCVTSARPRGASAKATWKPGWSAVRRRPPPLQRPRPVPPLAGALQ